MKKWIILILSANFAAGLYLIAYGLASSTKPLAAWSDLKAYSASVAADETLRPALALGGESAHGTFDDLIWAVWDLKNSWRPVIQVGIAQTIISVVGILCAIRLKGSSNNRLEATGVPPSPQP